MEKYIYFNSRDTFFRIALSCIIYFEADKNYTNMYLSNGQKLVFTFGLGVMKDYLKQTLQEDGNHFARIGKRFIINMNYLHEINILKQSLHLYDRTSNKLFTLSVSKGVLKELKDIYTKNRISYGKEG